MGGNQNRVQITKHKSDIGFPLVSFKITVLLSTMRRTFVGRANTTSFTLESSVSSQGPLPKEDPVGVCGAAVVVGVRG